MVSGYRRSEVMRKIPNLRSVSVSLWADKPFMAEALAERCVYWRKPDPKQSENARSHPASQ